MSELVIGLRFVLNDELFETKSSDEEFGPKVINNSLICLLIGNKFNDLFEGNDYTIGCIVCNENQINFTSNPLFICIKTLKSNESSVETTDSLELIVSQRFLNHYRLSVDDKHLFLKFIQKCPTISKLTIGVKDNDLYERVRSDVWSQTLLEVMTRNEMKILCRRYDIMCGNESLIVLNCEPVLQGILSLNTEIVVINISKSINQLDSCVDLMTEHNPNPEFDNKLVKALNLMNFTSRLLLNPSLSNSFDGIYNNSNPKSTAIQTLTASTTFLNSISISFKIIILSNSPSMAEIDCENGCVFVSNNALINKLKSEPKDWVRIWLSSDNKSSKLKQRFSQIFSIDFISDDSLAYISPQLWFNLQGLASNQSLNQPLIQPNTTLMVRKDVLLKEQIKYSPEVQLSLIQAPDYLANNDFSVILRNYFNKSRYIVKNDVIGVSAREDPLYHSKIKDFCENDWPVVYFRVSNIEGNGCLIDTNHSNLYQSGSTHSLIPSTLPSYYNQNIMTPFDNCPNPPGFGTYINKLCDIVSPYLMPKSQTIGTVMIEGPIGCGKKTIIRSLCQNWNLHLFHINTNDILGEGLTQTETKIKSCLSKASTYAPIVVLISNINILSNNELYDSSRITKTFSQGLYDLIETNNEWPVIIIATNSEPKKFANNELNSLFTHSLEIDCPTLEEREDIIKSLVGQMPTSDINFKVLSQKSAGFYLGDLKALVSKAIEFIFLSFNEGNDSFDMSSVALSGVVLMNEHLIKALNYLKKFRFNSIDSTNVPAVKWDDIGGHETIKQEILDTIQLPIDCPQLIDLGFKRSGVLLHGPPGTGKTLLAKAAATQCSLNFLSVKGPELINMYVGQSEENVRNIFSRARQCAPAVIFFDELDSLAPNRGRSGDSGGVMDRVVSQLLAEMDGINKSNQVFVIGATNRPDLLDSALLRPGRFDRLLYVGIAEDSESRLKILRALTRKFKFDSDVDLERIESLCPSGLSGADFYSICSNALMKSMERYIKNTDKSQTNEENCDLFVQMTDFLSVLPKIE